MNTPPTPTPTPSHHTKRIYVPSKRTVLDQVLAGCYRLDDYNGSFKEMQLDCTLAYRTDKDIAIRIKENPILETFKTECQSDYEIAVDWDLEMRCKFEGQSWGGWKEVQADAAVHFNADVPALKFVDKYPQYGGTSATFECRIRLRIIGHDRVADWMLSTPKTFSVDDQEKVHNEGRLDAFLDAGKTMTEYDFVEIESGAKSSYTANEKYQLYSQFYKIYKDVIPEGFTENHLIEGMVYGGMEQTLLRLANPEHERKLHDVQFDPLDDTGLNWLFNQEKETTFKLLCSFATFANLSYKTTRHEVQWIAKPRGYELVAGHLVPNQTTSEGKMKPNFVLLCNQNEKVAIFSIRGTQTLQDISTDIDAHSLDLGEGGKDLIFGKVHGGVLAPARWLADDANVVEWMLKLSRSEYRLVFTGHSLGGGMATLLAILTKNKHRELNISAITYCPAAVIEESMAERCKSIDGLVLRSFVNRDDIVPRAGLASFKDLADKLVKKRTLHSVFHTKDKAAGWWVAGYGGNALAIASSMGNSVATVYTKTQPPSGKEVPRKKDYLAGDDAASAARLSAEATAAEEAEAEAEAEATAAAAEAEAPAAPPAPPAPAVAQVLPRLVVPGDIFKSYDWRGQTLVAVVDHTHASMREIILSRWLLDDHLQENWVLSLQEIATAKKARDFGLNVPPKWEPLCNRDPSKAGKHTCSVCSFPVNFQLHAPAGIFADIHVGRVSHHCRACGKIVCEACSDQKMSLPHIGIGRNSRVCDSCANVVAW